MYSKYSKDKVILTDCDGVLLDWGHSFFQWMLARGHTPVEGAEKLYKIDEVFGMSQNITKPLVRQFNESAWMKDLTPFRDAVKYVRKLHEEHGFVFHCITSMSNDVKACQLRKENLEKIFGKGVFEVLNCLDCGADKDDALEPYRDSELWWIEDKPANADLGVELGLNSILLAHGHNVGYNGSAVRAMNWREVYETITG